MAFAQSNRNAMTAKAIANALPTQKPFAWNNHFPKTYILFGSTFWFPMRLYFWKSVFFYRKAIINYVPYIEINIICSISNLNIFSTYIDQEVVPSSIQEIILRFWNNMLFIHLLCLFHNQKTVHATLHPLPTGLSDALW